MQVQVPDKPFTRRYTDDGMIESICMKCFLTVCRCRTEEEVTKGEAKHVCQGQPNASNSIWL